MLYTIYKITNQINGKFYIGSHKTKDLNDSYMGSGKYLKHAQEKYGMENFTKEILFVFDTPEEMYAKEAEIVNESFIAEENTYNVKVGGYGGFDYINSNNTFDRSERGKMARSNSPGFTGQKHTKEHCERQSARKLGNKNFLGRKHSEETKLLMSDIAKKRMSDPSKNSQFGTMWITDGINNAKIKKTDLIPDGWRPGRILNS